MKIYYVVNARMPNEKAYGIQIAKMCEAFIEQGIELELCIPRTRQSHIPLREFYALRVDVPTRTFSSPDWYDRGRVAYAVSSFIFTLLVGWYLVRRRGSAVVYTIDMDPYSFSPIALLGMPVAVEMHSPKPSTILTRYFFRRAKSIITTNSLIKDKLASVFALKAERFIVEPNGVDPKAFEGMSREEARMTLGLATDAKIALYVGRFYDWKEMSVLQRAAEQLDTQGIRIYLIGGTKEDFERATKGSSFPLYFGGSVAHNAVTTWRAAADVMLVLGSRANEFSYRYTAPMKLFEYLASDRPVVAADTPALRSLISDHEALFYTSDDADDLARKISEACSHPDVSKIERGRQHAREHLWSRRAERICAFMAS